MDYVTGNFIMLQLGEFQFGLNTAAYQELQRTSEWRWASQEVFGGDPVLQNVGNGPDIITLSGVIFPEYRGGLGQIDAMRDFAGGGLPMLLVGGLGVVMGYWVIERLEEGQAVFAAAGVPRRIEFTLSLRKFSEII